MKKILKAQYTVSERINLKVYDVPEWDEVQLLYYIDGVLAEKGEENPFHFESYSRYSRQNRFETIEDVKATAATLAKEIANSKEKQEKLLNKYGKKQISKKNNIMGLFDKIDSAIFEEGGDSKKKESSFMSSGKSQNKERMKKIQDRAKKLKSENKGMKHTDAVSLASKQLKSEGKI